MFNHDETDEIAGWLGSPTMMKVASLIEERYSQAWKQAAKPEDREYCWRMIQCVRQVLAEMKGIVDSQRIESFNANRKHANNWSMPKPNGDGEAVVE